jgi:hypothetical protein
VGALLDIMEVSITPRVVSMVHTPCSPTMATLTIEALILKGVAAVVVIIKLVHVLIK